LTTALEPATPKPLNHPVRLRVIEDLSRSRLTVFFRLLLSIPHLIWLGIWTLGVVLVAFVAWFIVLFRRQLPDGLHRFFTMYIRYATHVNAYLNLAANPFPGFLGEDGYEVDLEFEPPAPQNRWKTGFRLFLALPALMLAGTLGGSANVQSGASYGLQASGLLFGCAFLAWWYAMFKARAPEGITRLQWYCLHYSAQTLSYCLLVTDRYPTTDPERLGVPWPAPAHPVTLAALADDGRRSRLTVFFRGLLAVPHLVWLVLWGIVAFVVAFLNWIVTLVRGRSPDAFHRFLAAYARYQTHVLAFLFLIANPFPGFSGRAGSYPVDLVIAPPERQNRWRTGFRGLLAFPAFVVSSGLGGGLFMAGLLGWFAALFTARMPEGLRKLGLLALRYNGQTYGYSYWLLTEQYPYAGPPA
jgi:hypothetical protein